MEIFPRKHTRRNFLTLFALGGLAYVRFGEPHWLAVARHDIVTGKGGGAQPVRLLQISDLHASEVVSLDYIQRALALGLEENPDLICLTGDFITSVYEDFARYGKILAALPRIAPTFACLGNHDGGPWSKRGYGYPDSRYVRELLARAGIDLLDNAHRDLVVRGRQLRLIGVGDVWNGELHPQVAFPSEQPVAADVFSIALSHNPDTKDELAGFPWDLLLCGHTHGGQVLIPMFGPPFASVQDRRFIQGLHRWHDRWLHISKGVGNLHGVRFNCRPEINVLTLI